MGSVPQSQTSSGLNKPTSGLCSFKLTFFKQNLIEPAELLGPQCKGLSKTLSMPCLVRGSEN
ncbi:hypothetical protein BVRB_8g196700 [Beta vulgaris subsp. vulgaris]|nr:hypothetical protein BVRB_8g196700 [Beta vulgaris subsp. vulgaris]